MIKKNGNVCKIIEQHGTDWFKRLKLLINTNINSKGFCCHFIYGNMVCMLRRS